MKATAVLDQDADADSVDAYLEEMFDAIASFTNDNEQCIHDNEGENSATTNWARIMK